MKTKTVVLELPVEDISKNGSVFWKAFDTVADNIPCNECKEEAKSFISFWHDIVNDKIGKKIYDEENFSLWKKKIWEKNYSNIVWLLVIFILILIILFK